jgi:hypothetical protein
VASIEPHDPYRGPFSEQTAAAFAEALGNLTNGAFDIALALEFEIDPLKYLSFPSNPR